MKTTKQIIVIFSFVLVSCFVFFLVYNSLQTKCKCKCSFKNKEYFFNSSEPSTSFKENITKAKDNAKQKYNTKQTNKSGGGISGVSSSLNPYDDLEDDNIKTQLELIELIIILSEVTGHTNHLFLTLIKTYNNELFKNINGKLGSVSEYTDTTNIMLPFKKDIIDELLLYVDTIEKELDNNSLNDATISTILTDITNKGIELIDVISSNVGTIDLTELTKKYNIRYKNIYNLLTNETNSNDKNGFHWDTIKKSFKAGVSSNFDDAIEIRLIDYKPVVRSEKPHKSPDQEFDDRMAKVKEMKENPPKCVRIENINEYKEIKKNTMKNMLVKSLNNILDQIGEGPEKEKDTKIRLINKDTMDTILENFPRQFKELNGLEQDILDFLNDYSNELEQYMNICKP